MFSKTKYTVQDHIPFRALLRFLTLCSLLYALSYWCSAVEPCSHFLANQIRHSKSLQQWTVELLDLVGYSRLHRGRDPSGHIKVETGKEVKKKH